MTSRDTSDAFMPCVPMVMPSEMVTVIELHRRAAGLANAFLQGIGDFAKMHIAGADLGPGIGDADNGLVQIVFGKT